MQGFRFVIFTTDHDPVHVHVLRNKDEARFNLVAPELVYVDGLKRLALQIVRDNAGVFMEKWLEIHS